MRNKHEIFTTIATHLLDQGEQSIVNKVCQYRTSSGLSCAVGCLFGPSYQPAFEGREFYEDELAAALRTQQVDVDDPEIRDLLTNLQRTHDHGMVGAWPTRLRQHADKFGVELTDELRSRICL